MSPHRREDLSSTDLAPPVERLQFGRSQFAILAVLIGMVIAIGFLGYRSYLSLEARTQELTDQLQVVSNNISSYEREVLSYGLLVERWADGSVSEQDRATARALLERQRRVNENLSDVALLELVGNVDRKLAVVDLLTTEPPSAFDNLFRRRELELAVDGMTAAAKALFNETEVTTSTLVYGLSDSLRQSRQVEIWATALVGMLVAALIVSLRQMFRTNYGVAREALAREQEQHLAVRRERAQVETQYQEIVDEVNDVVFRISENGCWAYLNRAWEVLSGVSVEETVGTVASEVWHPADSATITETIDGLVDGNISEARQEARLVRADGTKRIVVIGAKAVCDSHTGSTYLTGTINDVTDRVRAQELSTAQSRVLEMIVNDVPLRRVLDQIGESFSSHAGTGTVLTVATSDDKHDNEADGREILIDQATGEEIGAVEWKVANRARQPSTAQEVADEADIELRGVVALAARLGQTAIERHRSALLTAHRATHDALTGLPNRTLLADRIAMAVERTNRTSRPFAVLFLDVDRFKLVNDSLGHSAGDRLLFELSERLKSTVRAVDTVARFGGDEFVILLEDLEDQEQALRVADRMLAVTSDPIPVGAHQVRTSLSIGVVFGDGLSEVDEVLKSADIAMYRAKQEGRSCYKVFDEPMRQWAASRHERSLALQGAIDRNEMRLWYQPIVDLQSEQVSGYEALARWQHPDQGLVTPDQFIELIEDLGMINELGQWVLRSALEQAARWHELDPRLHIAVNVSGRELVQRNYADQVASALQVAGVPAELLLLEITEMVLIEDTAPVRRCLKQLKDLGVKLAIDDFGTGYSSLQYLRQLDVDRLKIDKLFISSGGVELHDPTIVSSITELSRALDLQVVAEGIETIEQRQALVELGVEAGQGYYFGRPKPAAEIEIPLRPAANQPN